MKIDVKYQAYAAGKWWADVVNYNNSNPNGYAGYITKPITAFRANLIGDPKVVGTLVYRMHKVGSKWTSWQTSRNKDRKGKDYAGTKKDQYDGIQMYIKGVSGKHVRYRVHCRKKGWLDWVTDYGNGSDGYAGWYGYTIDAIQVEVVEKAKTVTIGHARQNEFGGATGGKAGDQNSEVAITNWYLHNKGWVVIRPKDANIAEKIAKCMEMACKNNHIGYCQTHRNTLKTAAAKYKYDVSKVKVNVETDCSALVRVCCLYAGVNVGDFYTGNEASVLKSTKKFSVITSSKYCKSSNYLRRGDILCTKTKGHTVVVLVSGKYA